MERPQSLNKMQFPSVDRTLLQRSSAEAASPAAARVIPVAPVNPPMQSQGFSEPQPSVINLVNPALRSIDGDSVYTSTGDPTRRATEDATSPKDWTIQRPEPEKVENPPPKPMAQMLMEHLKTIWTAGASAIQIEQAKDLMTQPIPVNPSQAPGNLAKEVLTYEPAKIKKNEKL